MTIYDIAYLMMGWFASTIIFYSLGVQAGRKDGYYRGRAAGMRIGQDRRVSK